MSLNPNKIKIFSFFNSSTILIILIKLNGGVYIAKGIH